MKLTKEKIEDIRRHHEDYNSDSHVNQLLRHVDACEIEMERYRYNVGRLRKLVEQHVTSENRAVAAAYRWQKVAYDTQRELEKAREGKKVRLPRDVAEAIEKVKATTAGSDIDFLAWKIAKIPSDNEDPSMQLLQKRANYSSFLDLVDALRYGYIVEESASPLEREVADIIAEWESAEPVGTRREDHEHLARQILEHIKQENVRKSG